MNRKRGLYGEGTESISGKHGVTGGVSGAGPGIYGAEHESGHVEKRTNYYGFARNDLF